MTTKFTKLADGLYGATIDGRWVTVSKTRDGEWIAKSQSSSAAQTYRAKTRKLAVRRLREDYWF